MMQPTRCGILETLQFSHTKDFGGILMESPLMGPSNADDVGRLAYSPTSQCLYASDTLVPKISSGCIAYYRLCITVSVCWISQ